MPAVVLLLPKTSYQAADFLAAAERLGLDVVLASDVCHRLAEHWDSLPMAIRFRDAAAAAEQVAAEVASKRPVAVVGVDDQSALVAALAAQKLGLRHNPPEAVAAARNKELSRTRMRAAGMQVPRFEVVARDLAGADLDALLARAPYPCVVKPLVLSGSRGVIRADDPAGLRAALARVAALLRSPTVAERRDPDLHRVLIEEFIPGAEVALEGLLRNGRLEVLAIFDKPDPLDGPYFEETLYVTPSRHREMVQEAIRGAVQDATHALGLIEGPVHAELRLSPEGPRILEVAARSIGGLCGRSLRFGLGITLEDLVLRHALGDAQRPPPREHRAAGVLMLPIRKGGVLEEVRGIDDAKRVPLIEDVVITAHLREEIVPLPEGSSYLGFAFARGERPDEVEAALRTAGAKIELVVSPKLPRAAP